MFFFIFDPLSCLLSSPLFLLFTIRNFNQGFPI